MNILILRSNPIEPDPRVEKTARTLTRLGYQVTCLGWDRSGKMPKQQDRQGVNVLRIRIRAQYGSGLMNLPALLAWQLGLLWWLLTRSHKYQIIHACDFDTIIPALICQKMLKVRVVYDIFDFYADHLRRTPDFIKGIIRWLDYRAISLADGVILADDARQDQISGSRPKVLVSIYNSPEDINFDSSNELILDPNFEFHITYVGLLQVERGLCEMIRILRRHSEWHLDLAGFGGDEKQIVDCIASLPNITWHGRVDYQKALVISKQADVLFATYDPAIPNHRYASPNKVFEAMMLGKPVIVAENTNVDRIIKEMDCGISIKYGDETALEAALTLLATNRPYRETLGKNARRAYEEVFGWHNMQIRLKDLYSQIIQS
jgi:glycosyltransferase involved in cell wall biosynthesis